MTRHRVSSRRRLARWVLVSLLATALVLAPAPALGAAAQSFGRSTVALPDPGRTSPFTDVTGHWARAEIEALWARGAIPGTEVLFRPDAPVTRGAFVTFLVRALGYAGEATRLTTLPGPLATPFSDIAGGSDLGAYVSVAAEYGLVRGYPDGTFGPERPITRAEISALLVRVLRLEPAPPDPGALPFGDRTAVPAWASGYVMVAYQRGMVRGYPNGTFAPLAGATRAEAACLIGRAVSAAGGLYDLMGIVRGLSADGGTLAIDLWPAGTPEMALGGDGTAAFTPPSRLGSSPPGPTVLLQVPATAIVYRNGSPAARGDLAPLDEVSVILDASGAVAYVAATLTDGVGRLVSAGPAPDGGLPATLTLEPLGREAAPRTLPVLPWAPVFSDGREVDGPGGLRQVLAPGTRLYFILETATGAIRALAVSEPAAGPASGEATVAEVEDPSASPASVLTPAAAMKLNAASVGVQALRAATGADGDGVLIAVVDTGIDVTHPDLAMTNGLQRKVVDWCDFTGEGVVQTTRLSTETKGYIATDLGQAQVGGIISRSGFYHSGVFSEVSLDPSGPLGGDVDRNGSTADRFLVVAVDRRSSGTYDTVYVDTDRDLDLTDEVPLKPYRDSGLVAWFGDHARGHAEVCSFVLADVRADGNQATLGFDGNGHGTHVAAIAAAYGSYRGGLDGIAPGAKLLAIKALRSTGDGNWSDILQAVTYAAERGAHIVVLSVANLTRADDIAEETAAIRAVAERYRILVVVAAGNDGPGLGTARGPGAGAGVITVGASLGHEMWRAYYGYEVPGETVWPFSSVGPGAGGSGGPDVVAPGCAISAAPFWLEPTGYVQYEGTSMAVPHVAGVAALLWQAAFRSGLPVSSALVRDALLDTATPLTGYAYVEQGRGSVNGAYAWEWLAREAATGRDGEAHAAVPDGFYSRDGAPGRLLFSVTGAAVSGKSPPWVEVSSDAAWLAPAKEQLLLPAGLERPLPVDLDPGAAEGLYSGRVVASDGLFEPFSIPVTVVVPAEVGQDTGWRFSAGGTLGPARLARHYFRLPPGLARLEVTAGVPAVQGARGFDGRVRAYLYGPDGRLAGTTGYVGEGAGDPSGYAVLSVAEPQAGVWEVVVYGSAALSAFDLAHSDYWVEATVQGVAYDLPDGSWDVTIPAAGPSGGTLPATSPGSAVTRAWRPLTGVDEAGRPFEVWGAGQAAASGPALTGVRGEVAWTNVQPGFDGTVTGYGLWTEPWPGRPRAASLEPGQSLSLASPPLDGSPGLLRVLLRRTDARPSGNAGTGEPGVPWAGLTLSIYRRGATGWEECATMAVEDRPAGVIELENPRAGEYALYVEADPAGVGSASFEVATEWLPAGGEVGPTAEARSFAGLETGSLPFTVAAPAQTGVYLGCLSVTQRDGLGEPTRSLLPLTLRRVASQPQLTLCPGVFVPGRNLMTFQARDQGGRRLDSFRLELDGRLYQAAGGQITVCRDVPDGVRSLRLEARLVLPDGSAALWVFVLPAGEAGAEGAGSPGWLDTEGYRPGELESVRGEVAASLWGH